MSQKNAHLDSTAKHFNDPEQILLELWFSLSETERAKEFVDTKTAAEHASVSQRTIRCWIESGYLHALRVGKKYQVYEKSLKKFIANSTYSNR